MPYKRKCDKCGKEIELLFRPVENRPVYCERCFIVVTEEEIESIAESFNKITSEKELKEAIEFLAFRESQLITTPAFRDIRNLTRRIINQKIKRKDKRDEVLRLLRVEEVKRKVVD